MELEFTSFAALGTHLNEMKRRVPDAIQETLNYAAIRVLLIAYNKFGKYQPAIGGFSAWAPLSPETMRRRKKRGINPDEEPLLETTMLRESYEIINDGKAVVIGSTELYAIIQEAGDASRHIPARPVIGPSILEAEMTQPELASAFADVLLNGRKFRKLSKSKAQFLKGVTPGYGRPLFVKAT